MRQDDLIKIILSTDFKKAEKKIKKLFPKNNEDKEIKSFKQDLSTKIYHEANRLLQNKDFCRKARLNSNGSLDGYYKVMHAIYIYLKNNSQLEKYSEHVPLIDYGNFPKRIY